MQKLLVDSDVFIDYLRGYKKAISFIEGHLLAIKISVITIAELHAGSKNKQEDRILDDFLSLFEVILLNAEIAKLGGQIKNTYGKSHGTGLADALIAATASQEKASLVTLNKKHYPMFEEVLVPYLKL